jgi:Flp pilus assembly pilin Flp
MPAVARVITIARRGQTMISARTRAAFAAFVADVRGANMVEYIILVGVVAILAMAGFKYFGKNVNNTISLQAHTVDQVQSS